MKSVFEFKEHIENYELMLSEHELYVNDSYIEGYRIFQCDSGVVINHKHEYDIDLPQLDNRQYFYLEDVDIKVRIMSSIRTSSNSILYTCYNTYTIKDKTEYERLKEECDKKNQELIEQYKEQCKNANPTKTRQDYVSKELKKKKGFFARLFSQQ